MGGGPRGARVVLAHTPKHRQAKKSAEFFMMHIFNYGTWGVVGGATAALSSKKERAALRVLPWQPSSRARKGVGIG